MNKKMSRSLGPPVFSIFLLLGWAAGAASAQTAALPSGPGRSAPYKIITSPEKSGIPLKRYLVFDLATKEAALFDAGGPMEALIAEIKGGGLDLKYIFITHCHPDHIDGLPALRKAFPSVKVCFTREEFDDREPMSRWREIFSPALVDAWSKNPDLVRLMDYDYTAVVPPDIFLEDGQSYKLGGLNIGVMKTPGHSRGSVTYAVGNALIPGDLILYHETGYMDYQLGSKEATAASIQRLYGSFPDETVILPGHGDPSTIGFEKTGNKNVRLDKVIWDSN